MERDQLIFHFVSIHMEALLCPASKPLLTQDALLNPQEKIFFFPASNEMTQLNRIETTAFYVEITMLRSLDFLLNLCLQKIFAF